MNNEVFIRKAKQEDALNIAIIHKQQFNTHFLGKYSLKTIENFYKCFLNDDNFVLVSEKDNQVIGFVLGGDSCYLSKAQNVFLKKYRISYMLETVLKPHVYFSALSRIRMFCGSLFSDKSKMDNIAQNDLLINKNIRLLSIAVDEKAKGKNIADMLIKSFENYIYPNDYGLSVYKDNKRAVNFYLKNGFELEKEINNSLYLKKSLMS